MNEALLQLFRCPEIGKDLAVRACLRRQAECRPVRDGKGKLLEMTPVRRECVGCPVGQANLAASGVLAAPCRRCGAGLVDGEPCEVCETKEAEGVVQARTPVRAPPQDRLWAAYEGRPAEVPDPAIGPPPEQQAKRPWLDLERETSPGSGEAEAPEELEFDGSEPPRIGVEKRAEGSQPPAGAGNNPRNNPEPLSRPQAMQVEREGAGGAGAVAPPPAEPITNTVELAPAHPAPAQEGVMDERRKCTKCKTKSLNKNNTTGICNECARPWQARRKQGKAQRAVASVTSQARRALALQDMEVAELLDVRDQVLEELRKRRARAEQELRELDEAVAGPVVAKAV